MFPSGNNSARHVAVLANPANVATMETYVQRKTRTLWERLPILMYALMRCELFGINWFHLLGLDLLSMVRSAQRDHTTLHKIFSQKIAQLGFTDAKALLDENSHRFEELLQPLRQVESSVLGLTRELEEFRRSNVGKAFSKASNLSHDLVTQKQAAAAAEAALRDAAAAARAEADRREAGLRAEAIKLAAANARLEAARDRLAAELEEVQGRLQAAELRASHAEGEVEALREELDAQQHSARKERPPSPRQGKSSRLMAERWFSRPDSAEERQRAEMICKERLTQRGHSLQTLAMKFDCSELVMVTAENSLYFLGGQTEPLDAGATMKVHKLSLQSGTVSEGLVTHGKAPLVRRGHYCFFFRDPRAGPVIYVCGGVSWDGRVLFNDMHCLELATKTWRQVVSALPVGGVMTGSHNGPSMYLYGTSWEGGGASMCVLHSIAHARLMPPSSANGSADPVSASGYERPREPSSQRAYHTSTVSDWSRDGLRPDDMVNDDDADTGDEGDTPLMLPAPGDPAVADQRGSESTAGSAPPGDGDGEEGPDEGGEQRDGSRASSRGGTFLTEAEEAGDGAEGETEGGSDAPAEEAGTEAGAPEGGPDDGGGGDPLLLEAPPEAQDTGAPPSKAVAVSYSRVSPRPSSGPLVPSSRAGSTASGHRLASAPQRRPPRVPAARALPMSPIPGGAWMPHEDYRCWYQGSKALATLPGSKPPLRHTPARPDKRDFAGARFYGRTNTHERLYWSATPEASKLPAPPAEPDDWQASSIVRHVATVPTMPMTGTKGHEASDLVDMKSLENWDAWIQTHPGTLDASMAASLNLNGEEKQIFSFADRARPKTATSRLLMQRR